jgi:hypothetical protein
MPRSFEQTVAHYRALQEAAYTLANEAVLEAGVPRAPVLFRRYDALAESAWHLQWEGRRHPAGSGGWNWPKVMRSKWKRPSAFRLAIWSGTTLCGLAIGHPSRRSAAGRRKTLAVNLIEAAPFAHPLRGFVTLLTTTYATTYGRQLGSSWIRLIDPLPGAMPGYTALGFSVILKGNRPLYCEREI